MSDVVVGLDVHLKNTQVTIMRLNGELVKRERVETSRKELRRCLASVPKGSRVALESVGFCWPWIDFLMIFTHKKRAEKQLFNTYARATLDKHDLENGISIAA